jgi:hypothetical protein
MARRRGFTQREGNFSVNVHSMQAPNVVVAWFDDEIPNPRTSAR